MLINRGFKNQPLKIQRLVLKSAFFREKLNGCRRKLDLVGTIDQGALKKTDGNGRLKGTILSEGKNITVVQYQQNDVANGDVILSAPANKYHIIPSNTSLAWVSLFYDRFTANNPIIVLNPNSPPNPNASKGVFCFRSPAK